MSSRNRNVSTRALRNKGVVSEFGPSDYDPNDTTIKFMGIVRFPKFATAVLVVSIQLAIFIWALRSAYKIRLYAIEDFGYIIHEFDPWFNYRATQYLFDNGWNAFFSWFDHMSWYPLGRPVGTTIYPGLQLTAVAIHKVLAYYNMPMSLNNICCMIPVWGGVTATFFVFLITLEVTKSRTAASISALAMAVVPAHIMRSVGGGYDNESIAITAMLMTYFFWIRSVRTERSWPIGVITGLAYGYMVAAWGGYVLVLNMIALHAGFCMIIDMKQNTYSKGLYYAYSLFFIIGTAIATRVPPVGMAPFKSLEQILGMLVFIFGHSIYISEIQRNKEKVEIRSQRGIRIRMNYIGGTVTILALWTILLAPVGFFGPLSSRVRGLFLVHTRTGNPLVDSVAEHQPASADAYWMYLHICCYFWNISVFVYPFMKNGRARACSFMCLYSLVAYYFSLRMARLILLSGPVAVTGTGLCVGYLVEWSVKQFFFSGADIAEERLAAQGKDKYGKKLLKKGAWEESLEGSLVKLKLTFKSYRLYRQIVAALLLAVLFGSRIPSDFAGHSDRMARSFSNPQVLFRTQMSDGRSEIIDDYREAYFWLRDNTPEDARVMAWWDYGYQITGIANRTSIADGNTWNHEHIATLGKCMASPVAEAHSYVRHLADYVLVWAGGNGDDLGKSPHMARIANSVYHDICPKTDPLCTHFGFLGSNNEKPTPTMRRSLVYNLHSHNTRPGVKIDEKLFQESFKSRYGLVRIFQVMNVSEESKKWIADKANRKCDAVESWICPGQYPPDKEFQKMLANRQDFAQVEDFNRAKKNEEYHNEYMKHMNNQEG